MKSLQSPLFYPSNKNKISVKNTLYTLLIVTIYSYIIFSINTPQELGEVLFHSERDRGIISYEMNSLYQGGTIQIKVLTPKSFKKDKKYKVLYALPVSPENLDKWWINGLRVLSKHAIPDQYDVICVYPMFLRAPWYVDNPNNEKIKQESFILKEVIPFIDEQFNTIKSSQGRFLLGFSRSGFGALSLLVRNTNIFGGAAVWDGTLVFDSLKNWQAGVEEIFGTQENLRTYYLPAAIQKNSNQLRQSSPRIVLMGYAYPNTKQQTEIIHQIFINERIGHIFDISVKRKHAWNSGWVPKAIEYLFSEENN